MTAEEIAWWAILVAIFVIHRVGEYFTRKVIKLQDEQIEAQRGTIDSQKELIETMQGMAQLDRQVQSVLVQKLKDGGQL